MVSILHHLQNLVCKPSLVKLPNLEGNSIKNLKVELTIQIYIIEPSWSSGMNLGHFVFHYSKLCSKLKQHRYLYIKTRKEKSLTILRIVLQAVKRLKWDWRGEHLKLTKSDFWCSFFIFCKQLFLCSKVSVFIFNFSLFDSFWLIQSTGIVMQNSCIFFLIAYDV